MMCGTLMSPILMLSVYPNHCLLLLVATPQFNITFSAPLLSHARTFITHTHTHCAHAHTLGTVNYSIDKRKCHYTYDDEDTMAFISVELSGKNTNFMRKTRRKWFAQTNTHKTDNEEPHKKSFYCMFFCVARTNYRKCTPPRENSCVACVKKLISLCRASTKKTKRERY